MKIQLHSSIIILIMSTYWRLKHAEKCVMLWTKCVGYSAYMRSIFLIPSICVHLYVVAYCSFDNEIVLTLEWLEIRVYGDSWAWH